ncbi:hypothetical protein VTO42DRAFT_4268 [Malbranchea cinnamomea]
MEHDAPSGHPRSTRCPLNDASHRTNIPTSPERQTPEGLSSSHPAKRMKSSNVENVSEIADSRQVDNKRVSAVTESQQDSKRNSAISTTSTASGRSRRKTHIGPWQLGRTLGKGSSGRVRLAKHAVTGQYAAIKIISKKDAKLVQSQSIAAMDQNFEPTSSGQLDIPAAIEREVVIMKLIEHPNIMKLYDVWENRGELYLVLEYVEGGELYDYVRTTGALPEIEAVLLFKQIISALAYCHQFRICHRDLKPENILLDRNRNIKLADFGMAALQPEGHWLKTSCGSPHYASPEIIYGLKYRGDKADIWSCGIILFALLTGFLPFDGGDLRTTLKLVKNGEYVLPPWLTIEARDLIQRILQMRPEDRITIPEIFEHPLLIKYERHPLFMAINGQAIGPPPPAMPCARIVTRRQDIDMKILKSLRTLWHRATLEQLIENLLNDESNLEKLFYGLLLKFRDDHLENYDGQPLEYSSSDHHHMSRPYMSIAERRLQSRSVESPSRTPPNIPTSVDVPSCQWSGSYDEPKSARTVASYDPYRSSQTPIPNLQAGYARVVIHRPSSQDVSDTAKDTVATQDLSQQCTTELSDVVSEVPPPFSSSFRRSSIVSFKSHSSIGSTRVQRLNSPSTFRSSSYKRNVSFRHLRTCTPGNTVRKNGVSQYSLGRDSSDAMVQTRRASRTSSSPSLPTPPPPVRSRKHPEADGTQKLKTAKSPLSCQQWKEEARKVSLELGKICEEAFNRSSPSSSAAESGSGDSSQTPPASVSTSENHSNATDDSGSGSALLDYEPLESSATYAARELAETRRRLIEHSNNAAADGMPAYLSEVIAHLDRLIATEASTYVNSNRTDCSTARSRFQSLPPISEEGDNNNRSTKPGETTKVVNATPDRNTIRIVSPESPPTLDNIRPLTVRKRATKVLSTLPEHPADFLSGTIFDDDLNSDGSNLADSITGRYSRFHSTLEPIEEDSRSPGSSEVRNSGDTRKWSWFKHRSHQDDEDGPPPTPPLKDNVSARRTVTSGPNSAEGGHPFIHQLAQTLDARDGLGFKMTLPKQSRLKRIFGKKKPYKNSVHQIASGINDPDETIASIASAARSDSPNGSKQSSTMDDITSARQRSQSWFARLFHIKPASKALALKISKGRARKEVVKILREWRKYGLENVHVDRQTRVVRAKVGELNFLRLRPVEFSAEFFNVLERGRPINHSLMRLKLERGAASSFRKVVETLTVVVKQRKFLVEDLATAKVMCRLLDDPAY